MQLAIQYGRNVIVRRLLTYVGLARLDVHGKDVHGVYSRVMFFKAVVCSCLRVFAGRNVIDELEDMYWNGLVDSGATIGEDADATGTTSVDGETAGGASGTASVDGRGSRASTTSGPSTRKSSRVQDGVAVSDSRKSSRAQDVGASTPVAAKQSKSQAVSSVVKSTSSPAARTGTPGAAVVSQKDSPMVKTRGSVSFAVAGASAGAGTADNDDEETLSTSTTNAKPVKMSMVQRLREEVEATSADAMAAKTRAVSARCLCALSICHSGLCFVVSDAHCRRVQSVSVNCERVNYWT